MGGQKAKRCKGGHTELHVHVIVIVSLLLSDTTAAIVKRKPEIERVDESKVRKNRRTE